MKMQIGRWGNSLAVRLPKTLVDRFALSEGDELDSAALETALETFRADVVCKGREQALRQIRETRWPDLPADWKFDREEANAR